MAGELSGKVVIVSGGAQGLCSVITRRFAQDGARAVIADIDAERAEAGVRDLTAQGCDARFIPTRRAGQRAGRRHGGRVMDECGRCRLLVHGAGVGVHKEIVDLSDDEWDLQIDVQLRGAFS